jgi:sugar phosphate isomerase/epimerase
MGAINICTATLLADPLGAGEAEVRAAGEAARSAGFTNASVWAQHLPALAGSGLTVGVVEAAMQWANGGGDEAGAEARYFTEAAAEQQATLVLAVCLEPSIEEVSRARQNLAGLVAAATAVGARVCVEFLPWTGVPDLATAWSLVEPLGPAAGIVLDTWHWVRQPGGPNLELLSRIPGERIPYVQLSDAGPVASGDVMAETMSSRLLPGEGVVDFAALFSTLADIGADPYLATEVFNPGLVQERGAAEAAKAMKTAAEAVTPAR